MMKTTRNSYMTFVILLLLAVGFAGCGDSSEEKISSDECECGEQFIRNVEGSGTVSYNEVVGKWQISSHVQGTYDTAYLYLVSGNNNLDEYNNLMVNFSGKVYSIQSEKMPVVSAGTECFCLLLETINFKP